MSPAKRKQRGRPRKPLDIPDTERPVRRKEVASATPHPHAHAHASIEQRRARDRLAQEKLRKRRTAEVEDLQRAVRQLQACIEGMSEEFVAIAAIAMRSRNPRVLAEVRSVMERFTAHARRAEAVGESAEPDVSQNPNEDIRLAEMIEDEPLRPREHSIAVDLAPEFPQRSIQDQPQNHQALTPRLNYGVLWVSPPPQASHAAPPDIANYILAGRDSFVARLYFNVLSLTHNSLYGLAGLDSSLAWQFFRYTFRFEDPMVMAGVTRQRLERLMFRDGTWGWDSESESEGEAEEGAAAGGETVLGGLRAAVVGEVVADGFEERDFLDLWTLDSYLRSKWGLQLDVDLFVRSGMASYGRPNMLLPYKKTLPSPSGGSIERGMDELSSRYQDINTLLANLSLQTTCLGNGPHWHVQAVDTTVLDWLE